MIERLVEAPVDDEPTAGVLVESEASGRAILIRTEEDGTRLVYCFRKGFRTGVTPLWDTVKAQELRGVVGRELGTKHTNVSACLYVERVEEDFLFRSSQALPIRHPLDRRHSRDTHSFRE